MSITTDKEALRQKHAEANIALKYIRVFKDVYDRLKVLDRQVTEDSATSDFDTVPTSIKQPLVAFRNEVRAFNAAVEADTDIVELLNIEQPETPE